SHQKAHRHDDAEEGKERPELALGDGPKGEADRFGQWHEGRGGKTLGRKDGKAERRKDRTQNAGEPPSGQGSRRAALHVLPSFRLSVLFVSKRLHRIEPARLAGRIEAEEDPGDGRREDGGDDRPERDGRRERRGGANEPG